MAPRPPRPKPSDDPLGGQAVRDITSLADETPPYYVADQTLFIDNVRAFNVGDHVPPGHVDTYSWHDRVHPPQPPEPPSMNEPETPHGQATPEREGDA